jgi:hypothetical protein
MSTTTSSYKKALVQGRLQRQAQAAAGLTPFSSESVKRLYQLIRDGVDRMETDGVLDDANRVLEAEQAIHHFVTGMLRARGTDDYMGESTFEQVKNALCPGLFPFC